MFRCSINYKVSVIVPVYGVERFIERCAVSLFEQTYDNIEYVFVDDKTPDKSIIVLKEILNRYPARKNFVKIIEHDLNRGLSSARETGIQACTGDFIVHVDSDDFIDCDMLRQLVVVAAENNADVVVAGTKQEYGDKSLDDFRACSEKDKNTYLRRMLRQELPSNIWGKMFKTSLYKDCDIHCIPGISYGEDFAVLPKLLYQAKKISCVEKPLYHYVHYNTGSFTNVFKWKNLEDLMVVEKNLMDFFRHDEILLQDIKISHLKWTAWTLRRVFESNSDVEKALDMLGKPKVQLRSIKNFSLNHKLILVPYKFGALSFVKFYVNLSKKFLGKMVLKK